MGVWRGGGRRCARNATDGRPRASPQPRPEPDWAKPIITASERELRETSRFRMNMGKYSTPKKSPAGAGLFLLPNAYLLVLLSFFSSALAFALALAPVFEDLAFFAVLTTLADFAEGVAGWVVVPVCPLGAAGSAFCA